MFTTPITFNKYLIQYPTENVNIAHIILTFCYMLNIDPTYWDIIDRSYLQSTFQKVFLSLQNYSSKVKDYPCKFPPCVMSSVIPLLHMIPLVISPNIIVEKTFFKKYTSISPTYIKLLKVYDMDALKVGRKLIQEQPVLQKDLAQTIVNLQTFIQNLPPQKKKFYTLNPWDLP